MPTQEKKPTVLLEKQQTNTRHLQKKYNKQITTNMYSVLKGHMQMWNLVTLIAINLEKMHSFLMSLSQRQI